MRLLIAATSRTQPLRGHPVTRRAHAYALDEGWVSAGGLRPHGPFTSNGPQQTFASTTFVMVCPGRCRRRAWSHKLDERIVQVSFKRLRPLTCVIGAAAKRGRNSR